MSPPREPAGRAVVLGGTGWLGRCVSRAMTGAGYDVVVATRNPAPDLPGITLDLRTAMVGELRELVGDAEVVVNATDGANATDGWAHDERDLAAVNVDAVRRLVSALAATTARPFLVHVGTIHEYGPLARGDRVSDRTVPAAVGAYARSKLAGSRAVLDAAAAGRIDAAVLRMVNLVGPRPSPASFPGTLLSLARRAARGEIVEVPVATSRRDFLDVRDAAAACLATAGARPTGRALPVGSGVATPVCDVVAAMGDAAGLTPSTWRTRPLHGPADWTLTDPTPAARATGWRARTAVRDSMDAAWQADHVLVPELEEKT